MRIGRILFLAISLFAISIILGSSAFLEQQANNYAAQYQGQGLAAAASKTALKEKYQQDLLAILSQAENQKTPVSEVEAKLLNLTVPAEYRDLHFKLASAFGGLSGQAEASKSAREQLAKLQQTYVWLAGKLTIFLIHNF
ncbi:MAG: hypothetical protein NTZ18_01315 [Candidatus Komeilibacteria bacterium]|nr:hypothetical protein [Candidatus Komeilibacteria bacterium]